VGRAPYFADRINGFPVKNLFPGKKMRAIPMKRGAVPGKKGGLPVKTLSRAEKVDGYTRESVL
jgi:hypothetical protein